VAYLKERDSIVTSQIQAESRDSLCVNTDVTPTSKAKSGFGKQIYVS